MTQKIIVIGSSNVDFVMKMPRLPIPGETVTNASFLQAFGGKGANQAVAAAKAGGDAWFVSCLGDDVLGPLVRENLARAGVHVEHVTTAKDTATGTALIMVGGAGENIIAVVRVERRLYALKMVPLFGPETIAGFNPVDDRSYQAGVVGLSLADVYKPGKTG